MKKLFISIIAVLMFVGLSATSVSAQSYKVEKGDTLWGIADNHDVSVEKLKDNNDLDTDIILPDQKLSIDKEKKEDSKEKSEDEDKKSEGETVDVSATAYTAECSGCSGVTATGVDLNEDPDKKVIAVDPDVIPLGSEVHVEGYGDAVAADTGGAINDKKIDVHVPNEDKAMEWGVKDVEVTILD